jgi:DNA-binding SARP family transcriptional activator
MKGLEVRLFGKVRVEWDGRPVSSLSAKALELLCFLMVHRDRAHTRETLAGVLWPEASYSLSSKYFRQTLWQLQTSLGSHSGNGNGRALAPALFILNPGWVRLNPGAGWWLDVQAFEDADLICRDIPGQHLTDAHAQVMEEAISLYHGDLIEAWYQDWCIYERDRLQLTYLAMLEKLMRWCEARGLYARGVAYGQRILRYDRARECTHRQLMRLYYQAGDRTTALRQYERCATAVAREFNLAPSEETSRLYRQVREGRLEDTPGVAAGGTGGELLVDLHARLDHIQASMTALQDQIRHLARISETLRDNLHGAWQTLQETR